MRYKPYLKQQLLQRAEQKFLPATPQQVCGPTLKLDSGQLEVAKRDPAAYDDYGGLDSAAGNYAE